MVRDGHESLSRSLSIQSKFVKNKTVPGSDQKVLSVQLVYTQGGEESEEAIFNSTVLYSITD